MSKREPSPYFLGEKVRMNGTAEKQRNATRTEFVEAPLPCKYTYTGRRVDLHVGIIIGSRTVQPGVTHKDWEEGATFIPDTGLSRRVWLVAFDMRRKPVMCFDHQVESVEVTDDD